MDGSRLIWVDLEMTGLDVDKERIIEMATIVTDGELQVVAEGPHLVIHQDDAVLAAMDDWNTKHHGASGLVERVRSSQVTEGQAEAQTLAFLKEHCPKGACPLAGNSVHQDRLFLARYMTTLANYCHYRNVDVSTVKELAKRWRPDIVKAAPAKQERHRALDDIRESIAELAYYRTAFFVP